jgi:PAS domain S-box-containing protein
MRARLRQLAPVGLVLGLTIAGFLLARAFGEMDARRASTHRADIAATQVRDRVAQASTLADGVRRFLVGPARPTKEFSDVGGWLSLVGVPAAAWVERVPLSQRAAYERRTGHPILEATPSGGVVPAGPRPSYLAGTLVTGVPPMGAPGIDLATAPQVPAAVARPQTAYRVTATSLTRFSGGTRGLFLVQSAQRLSRGVVEPGYVVLFVPASWLLAAAANADSSPLTPELRLTVGGTSAGKLEGATARSTFAAAGQRFGVEVPRRKVHGAAEVLPWLILTAGLVFATLAGALGVIAARRAKAKADVDRLFTISPDLIVVAGFDGYFKRVNPAFEATLGYTEQEALTQPYIGLVHPDDRERTSGKAQEIQKGEATLSFENRYICKNGSYRWIEWTVTPVLAERQIYAVGRDVTQRRQAATDLRQAEERTRALAEEQAALRRVATLVARGVPPEELFAAVTTEVGQLLPVGSAAMGRCDPDGMFTTVAAWTTGVAAFPVGRRWIPEGKNVMTLVFETGLPARLDDFADASGPVGIAAREAGYRSAVGTPIMVEGRLWGVMTAASSAEQLPSDTESRLASFTELVATAIANAEGRAALARLADEQAALRRVATLVAEDVQPAKVFSALCQEVNRLLDAQTCVILRREADGTATIVAYDGITTPALGLNTRLKPEPGWVLTAVLETGRPAREDDYSGTSERLAGIINDLGIQSSVGVPIVVEGSLWGVIIIGTVRARFPDHTGQRLEEFTELAAAAIANAESRAALGRLANQQAALRRVATLVAEGVPPAEVFSALSEEVSLLVDAEAVVIGRLERDGRLTVLAVSGTAVDRSLLGTEFEPEPNTVLGMVVKTGRSARMDDYSEASDSARSLGIRSGVGVPIVVGGAPWGVVGIGTVLERFPDNTRQRLEEFTELAATAIANAETRSELAASRARIVATSDETRRRIERDLHDGTQQRLVSLSLDLRLAESTVPDELEEPRRTIARVAGELDGVIDELREISRGIHPAILSEGGLGPAFRTLARRSAIPVELDNSIAERLPEPLEVAAYYVVSEALANATKHANASCVGVEAATRDSSLRLSIRDDGVGGADPGRGSGLVGLRDRVEALGGSIEISSPPGHGTHVAVQLPLELDLPVDEAAEPEPEGLPANR